MPSIFLHRALLVFSSLLLGASMVHWVMQWRNDPYLPSTALAKQVKSVNADLDTPLFGRSSTQNWVPDSPVAAAPSNLKLIGVITGARQGRGVAIISVDGKSSPFKEGDEIAPGTTLQSVLRNSVIAIQNNQPLELALDPLNKNGAATPPQIGTNARASNVPSNGLNSKIPFFRLDVQNLGPNHFSFSQAELNKGLQDPKLRNSLGDAIPSPTGGLLLKEVSSGSLLDRLGLRSGDILRQANGQALNNLADIPSLYQQFGNGGMVKLELLRGGQPSQIQYTVRP
jgi:type II secretory pathway component PulC